MTCRFCGNFNCRFDLIKYGVRQYAHPDCGLKAKGIAFFDLLQDWQLEQFPYFAAKEAGVQEELERRVKLYRDGQ